MTQLIVLLKILTGMALIIFGAAFVIALAKLDDERDGIPLSPFVLAFAVGIYIIFHMASQV